MKSELNYWSENQERYSETLQEVECSYHNPGSSQVPRLQDQGIELEYLI